MKSDVVDAVAVDTGAERSAACRRVPKSVEHGTTEVCDQ